MPAKAEGEENKSSSNLDIKGADSTMVLPLSF